MVLVAMGEDDPEQILAPLLDEGQIGQDQLDARIGWIGKGHAEIDHHPFAVAAIEIDVHADLARAAEREEKEFFAGCHVCPSKSSLPPQAMGRRDHAKHDGGAFRRRKPNHPRSDGSLPMRHAHREDNGMRRQ